MSGTKLLINAETSAVIASDETTFTKAANNFTKTLSASNLQGSEQITVEFQNVDGSWSSASDGNGPVFLTATRPQLLVEGTGRYRVSKGATVAAVSVGVQ